MNGISSIRSTYEKWASSKASGQQQTQDATGGTAIAEEERTRTPGVAVPESIPVTQRSMMGITNAEVRVSSDGDTLEISQIGMDQVSSLNTAEESEEEESTSDLSMYSTLQLAQLLADGTITNAQYLAEIRRREQAEMAISQQDTSIPTI